MVAKTSSFEHPGTLLWRTREIECLAKFTSKYFQKYPVLDLGCAEGGVSALIFPEQILVGIDRDGAVLRSNQHKAYRHLAAADGARLPFKASSFTGVFSNSVIEHVKELDSLLKETARVLKDEGYFIFTVPDKRLSDYLGKPYCYLRNRQLNHFNLMDIKGWSSVLKKHGLTVMAQANYLTRDEIFAWDKMCLFLRLSAFLPRFREHLRKKYLAEAEKFLERSAGVLDEGAGLLVVARKGSSA